MAICRKKEAENVVTMPITTKMVDCIVDADTVTKTKRSHNQLKIMLFQKQQEAEAA